MKTSKNTFVKNVFSLANVGVDKVEVFEIKLLVKF
jgi:hypothetical protein